MTSNRPYLIRAIYEWLLDNECTPHLLIDANAEGVEVPQKFAQDGKIVLNVGPTAVEALSINNEEVTFMARFSGVSQLVALPVHAVLAIYAKENGRGMLFEEGENGPDEPGPKGKPDVKPPSLKVVK